MLAFLTILTTYLLIVFPEASFNASLRGLHIWWEIVFPSLLPFFIIAELLISFGVVQFIGVLFQPIMRPLFNVPGIGSFAWILGMASGYPSGAKISARLREKNEISQIEAERLVSFSNASSPLFIFGAISIGFFQNPTLGILIAVCHYTSNVIVGICMRFYGKSDKKVTKESSGKQRLFIQGLQKMHQTRINETRPFGQIIGDAVMTSVQTLIMIGGFIILFSVLTTFLSVTHFTSIVSFVVQPLFHLLQIPNDIIAPILTGIFEITMGIEKISLLTTITPLTQVVLINFILGFNGFSVQAQVASILAKTDIRFAPYFFARILHGIFASILAFFFYRFFFPEQAEPTFLGLQKTPFYSLFDAILYFGPLITIATLLVTVCIITKRFMNQAK